jgi:uncharacterized membrane protein YeaQ/YmgE (transglycosylase-associated protein family)
MPEPAFTLLTWLAIGGVVGWLDGTLFQPAEREPILLHIAVWAAAALAGGYVCDGVVRARSGADPGYLSFVLAAVTAVVLLGVWRAVVRGTDSVGKSN